MVIITFDDGYSDNLYSAAPLLTKHGVHAVFYIFTGWIEDIAEAWWDRLENAVFDAATLPPLLRLPGIEGGFATGNRASLFESLYYPLRNTERGRREEIIVALESGSGRTAEVRPTYRPLTSAELRQLAKTPGVHIGAHTVTHPFLPSLSDGGSSSKSLPVGRGWSGNSASRFEIFLTPMVLRARQREPPRPPPACRPQSPVKRARPGGQTTRSPFHASWCTTGMAMSLPGV